jgi:hypothetical protein
MSAAADVTPAVGLLPLAVLLALAAVSGLFLSRLFRATLASDASSIGIADSFSLVAPALTAVFLTVQFSLPLSIGLLGALSLVRFRTPVKQPEEIAFLLVLIATCVSIGAYKLALTGVLLGAAVCVSIAHRLLFSRTAVTGGVVEVTLPGSCDPLTTIPLAARREHPGWPLESMSVGAAGTRLTWRFGGDPEPLVRELRLELAQTAPAARIDVFLNRERPL